MTSRPELPDGPYLVVGLARSGIAASLMLRQRGESVIGVDAGALGGLEALANAGAQVRLGEDGVALLDGVGAVVKSPGVPREAPVIMAARAGGVPVLGELELAWRLLANELIAVTGTNGKTTTVELIGHIYRAAGLPVTVAGNVGVALSSLVDRIDESVTIVCETSSFQLEDTLAFAPEAAVLLNITPDHLDRHGTLEDYTAAKLQIFARQGEDDLAILPFDLGIEVGGRARRVYFGDEQDPSIAGELRLRGRHNLRNAMAAVAVCRARGVDPAAIRAGLRSFPGAPHRLEEVASSAGVLYVNDSKATNVTSTLVALEAFPDGVVHLILGGQAKGQDFSALRPAVEASCRAVYLVGEDAPLIAGALAGASVPVRESGELEHALLAAIDAAAVGDVVLLSPACASFDQFTDYEARGERFRELVRELAEA